MRHHDPRPSWGASQHLTDRVLHTLERFLHIEAVSGGVLIAAAIVALVWANSVFADSYHALWHVPITIGVGPWIARPTLHFVINDGLMTIFFLVAGLEIRRELHEGSLATLRSAALPIVAAIGGVIAPALIYLSFNWSVNREGWAIPIATDIAFALGVLALLGRRIPAGVRVFLLALAIIDDIAAVLVIAIAYSHDLKPAGALLAAAAVGLVFVLQRLGIRRAVAYVVPGVMLWTGLWYLGVHPTLAGVVLGLLTPTTSLNSRAARKLPEALAVAARDAQRDDAPRAAVAAKLGDIQLAQRDLLPPAVDVQSALHGWVAYGIMPLFALANAGVHLGDVGSIENDNAAIGFGIAVGLLLGKPLGILCASAATIRLGWCELPADVGWRGLSLVAMLGGIGFTMSIFIAGLAFQSPEMLVTAKLAILVASTVAAGVGLFVGRVLFAGVSAREQQPR